MGKKTTVRQTEGKEVPTEVLATSIKALADGMRKLRNGRLSDRAIFLLVQDASPNVGGKYGSAKLSMKDIRAVFSGLDNLEAAFLRKPPKNREAS